MIKCLYEFRERLLFVPFVLFLVVNFIFTSVTSNTVFYPLDAVSLQYMLVYCDVNAVKMGLEGVLKPAPLCPFLRNEG